MSPTMIGALLGLVAGSAAAWAFWRSPLLQRPSLADRVDHYVRDLATPSNLLAQRPVRNPLSFLEQLAWPWVASLSTWLERVSGNAVVLRQRLDQAGWVMSVEQFRAQQLVWAVLGTAAGTAMAMSLAARGTRNLGLLLLVVALSGFSAMLARDHLLGRAIARRRQRILIEFPIVAELLALSVSAGEGAPAAMQRIARSTQGELSLEFRRAMADVHAGATLVAALTGIATRLQMLPITIFIDGVQVSLNRGTPLAEVLRAQAQDARELSRRTLMEQGGQREIGMLVPVVFLVLPITVVFAMYPGLAGLSVGQ